MSFIHKIENRLSGKRDESLSTDGGLILVNSAISGFGQLGGQLTCLQQILFPNLFMLADDKFVSVKNATRWDMKTIFFKYQNQYY